jgi:hypothetical protein
MKSVRSIFLLLSAIQGIVAATNNKVRGSTLASSNSAVNSDMDLKQRQLKHRMMMMVRTADNEKQYDGDSHRQRQVPIQSKQL